MNMPIYKDSTGADYPAAEGGSIDPFLPLSEYRFLEIDDARHFGLRKAYRERYGYVLPTREVMDRLVGEMHGSFGPDGRLLDAGSGSGYLSKELGRRGINSFAVDKCGYETPDITYGYPIKHVYQRDAMGDAVGLVSQGFDAILLAWPPYEWSFGQDIAQAMFPGQWLIYVGEPRNGCCANDAFFDYLDNRLVWAPCPEQSALLNQVHIALPGVHDQWAVWRKRDSRDSLRNHSTLVP